MPFLFLSGSGRRYQLYALQTSKACNILSKYTAFVPIDLDSNEYLPISIEYRYAGESHVSLMSFELSVSMSASLSWEFI